MAFVIGAISSVRRKVSFEEFSDEGKRAEKVDFIVTLKVHDAGKIRERQEELAEFWRKSQKQLEKLRKDPDAEVELQQESFDERYLKEDVLDIDGVMDAERNPIPFAEGVLDAVLQHRRARAALMKVWNELNLNDGAKKGN